MIKRFLALLCCLLLAASVAQAAIDWPVLTTQGQQAAQTYIAQVNTNLSSLGAANINSLFECYPVIMSLGITAQDNADTPEGVELSLQLQEEGMVSLTVRSIYPDSFGALAGSCVQAADPSRTLEDTVNEAAAKAAMAQQSPDDSTIPLRMSWGRRTGIRAIPCGSTMRTGLTNILMGTTGFRRC